MKRIVFIILLSLCAILPTFAQRYITPVDPTAKREIVEEEVDSLYLMDEEVEPEKPKVEGHIYPLVNGLMVTVNIMDGIANIFGQSYGNYEVAAELDLHNRFFPIWEIGIGYANNTPEEMNFTYRNKPSLYNRVGLNYNFSYNKEDMSFFYIGVRYGFSFFTYDIDNITIDNPYWGEYEKLSISGEKSYAHWGEALGGLRVQVYKNFYMGWTARYRFLFSDKKSKNSAPWYIPGFGTENSPFGFTYTLGYRFSLGGGARKSDVQPVIE